MNPNLTPSQQVALTSLKNNTKIIIKPPDKGGSVVIMNWPKYARMCMNILDNKAWYWRIPEGKLRAFYQEFRDIIAIAYVDGIIDKNTYELLNVQHLVTNFLLITQDT